MYICIYIYIYIYIINVYIYIYVYTYIRYKDTHILFVNGCHFWPKTLEFCVRILFKMASTEPLIPQEQEELERQIGSSGRLTGKRFFVRVSKGIAHRWPPKIPEVEFTWIHGIYDCTDVIHDCITYHLYLDDAWIHFGQLLLVFPSHVAHRFPWEMLHRFDMFFGKSQYVASNLPGDWLLCEPEKMFEEYSESAAASAWNARKAGPHLCDESYIHLHVGHFLGGNVGKCFTHESLK